MSSAKFITSTSQVTENFLVLLLLVYHSELNCFPQISRAFLAPKAPLVSSAASAKLSQQTSSSSSSSGQRFGVSDGGSGWKWDKGGVGMGGKDKGTNIGKKKNKPNCGQRCLYCCCF